MHTPSESQVTETTKQAKDTKHKIKHNKLFIKPKKKKLSQIQSSFKSKHKILIIP